MESPGGVSGALGVVLEVSWEVLGRSWRRIRGVLNAPEVVLGALEAMLEPSGGQTASKMRFKSSPNRAPKATLAEYAETLIFNDGCKDFNDF